MGDCRRTASLKLIFLPYARIFNHKNIILRDLGMGPTSGCAGTAGYPPCRLIDYDLSPMKLRWAAFVDANPLPARMHMLLVGPTLR